MAYIEEDTVKLQVRVPKSTADMVERLREAQAVDPGTSAVVRHALQLGLARMMRDAGLEGRRPRSGRKR